MPQEPWAELGETIGAIRAELRSAMEAGGDGGPKFRTGPVELEFTVEAKKDAGARTRVFVLPWTIEAHGGAGVGRTHRVKLTLQPVDEHGEDLRISAHSPQRPRQCRTVGEVATCRVRDGTGDGQNEGRGDLESGPRRVGQRIPDR